MDLGAPFHFDWDWLRNTNFLKPTNFSGHKLWLARTCLTATDNLNPATKR
jgi:hypothetical protein